VAGALLYGLVDPESSRLFPRCLFKTVTGYDCPGCGSQRAIHALLRGDIAGAFHYNAFMVSCIPLVMLLLVGEYLRVFHPSVIPSSPVLRRLERFFSSRGFIFFVIAAALLWWIFRLWGGQRG